MIAMTCFVRSAVCSSCDEGCKCTRIRRCPTAQQQANTEQDEPEDAARYSALPRNATVSRSKGAFDNATETLGVGAGGRVVVTWDWSKSFPGDLPAGVERAGRMCAADGVLHGDSCALCWGGDRSELGEGNEVRRR